ncbi:MAG: hypothetical protein K0S47_506 [Herbinix sp.]|jgi:hypothetical protein|nr:hypothetical protein [Herbinix sp.]
MHQLPLIFVFICTIFISGVCKNKSFILDREGKEPMNLQEKIETKLRLESHFKNGVNWYYWIAALSLINTVILLMNGSWSFIAGLGITQIVDAGAYVFRDYLGNGIVMIALLINLIIIGFFALMGFYANKRVRWVIILGMILYSIDTLIFIYTKDYISIAFHVYAIYSIYKGMKACDQLMEIEESERDYTEIF